jgi:hypothetical protein
VASFFILVFPYGLSPPTSIGGVAAKMSVSFSKMQAAWRNYFPKGQKAYKFRAPDEFFQRHNPKFPFRFAQARARAKSQQNSARRGLLPL